MKKMLLILALFATNVMAMDVHTANRYITEMCPGVQDVAENSYELKSLGEKHSAALKFVRKGIDRNKTPITYSLMMRAVDFGYASDSLTDARMQAGLYCQSFFLMKIR